jgi:dephospho-CoA kinase
MTRNTCSRQEAASRLEAQMPIDEKVPYADIVIENRGFQEMTKRVVDDVWKDLIQRERKHRLNS